MKPLEVVKAQIESIVRMEKAQTAASREAEALAAELNKTKPVPGNALLAGFAQAKTISALGAEGFPQLVAQSVLNTGVASLPAAKVIGLGDQGYAVAWVVSEASAAQVKAKVDPQVVSFYEGISGQIYQEALALAAREALTKRIKVEIKKEF